MRRLALCCLMLATLAACETVQGFGQDVGTAGRVIEREAVEAQ